MAHQDFRISRNTVWLLVIGNILLITAGSFGRLLQWDYAQLLLILGVVIFFSTWIVVMSDMVKNKIADKSFWIISMFLVPAIAPIFYLIKRNRLIRNRQE